jgi:hypothetical protein
MSTPARTSGPAAAEPAQGRGWRPAVRALVSVAILWHLAAVVLAPLSMPSTILGDHLRPVFQPYLSATYLDHGYKFFAPDPGPSHLIKYELTMADGSKQKGVLPDPVEDRPRLFYHRHFMLSEFINNLPPELPPPPSRPGEPMPELDWVKLKPSLVQRQFSLSYANHLLKKFGASSVTLVLEEHLIPPPERVAEGQPLNHSSMYRQRTLGTFTGERP